MTLGRTCCVTDAAEPCAGSDGSRGGRAAEREGGRVAVSGADSAAAVAGPGTGGGNGGHATERVGVIAEETGHGLSLLIIILPSRT